jgi:hypothetical protein
VAGRAGLTQATVAASGPATWVPGAAVAVGASVVLDNDDPLVAGGHVVADYGAVLSGWSLSSPSGRPAVLDERVGAAAPCSSPSIRSSARRARAPRRCSRLP